MLPKRRLSEEDTEAVPSNTSPEAGKKKKKLDPEWQISTLYDFIRKYKREDGTELCEPFIRAPKRRNDPGFYEGVSTPMDLLRIQQKMKMEEYESLWVFKEDVDLMLSHWLAYYPENSEESKNARELKELFYKAYERVEAGENPAVSLGEREGLGELAWLLEELFVSLLSATSEEEPQRFLSDPFKLLPSKKLYPGYYEVIKDPIDLKTIATKMQEHAYGSIVELEEDFLLMCKNAMTFNEPGSQIYRDAKSIIKLAKNKKTELETFRLNRDKRGAGRPPARRQIIRKQYSSAEVVIRVLILIISILVTIIIFEYRFLK
ncbi:protein polybromo-1-like [Lepeophtheirus salmonis]|uniref:protein polybromo-1-like n=1 Tax=Lepeophtheirus salmonis TaxID=72036 RepID=UPI003AF4065F